MKVKPEKNNSVRKCYVAWYELSGTSSEESIADKFLESIGVNLQEVTTDSLDGEFYTSFPFYVVETKAKDLCWLRKQLKLFIRSVQ